MHNAGFGFFFREASVTIPFIARHRSSCRSSAQGKPRINISASCTRYEGRNFCGLRLLDQAPFVTEAPLSEYDCHND